MKRLFILSFTIFVTSRVFDQQTSTGAIKRTINTMTPDQLQEVTKFGKHNNITRRALFGKAFEHQTHQRGQTTIYLRLKGVTPPSELLF